MTRRIALAVLLLAGCAADGEDTAAADEGPVVTVATAERTTFPVTLSSTGVVTPRPGSMSELAAPGASRITSIRVGIGDVVRAGQILATLDATVWQAQLEQAEAGAAAARQANERADRLATQGILPRKEAEQTAAELASAEAALAAARRTRSLAELRSPIAGVVDSMDASLDEMVTEGSVLVRVVDPRAIEVVLRLSPEDAALVRTGMRTTFTTRSTDSAVAVGLVKAIAPGIEPASGSVAVRASIAESARRLRVGEIVNGQIEIERHEDVVVVPATSIVSDTDAGGTLYIVDADGIAHARTVRFGVRGNGRIEVLEGVQPGDRVITRGSYTLQDSVHVRIESGS